MSVVLQQKSPQNQREAVTVSNLITPIYMQLLGSSSLELVEWDDLYIDTYQRLLWGCHVSGVIERLVVCHLADSLIFLP